MPKDWYFTGQEEIEGVVESRTFHVHGVNSEARARDEIAKWHPNATEIARVEAESGGIGDMTPPRIIRGTAQPTQAAPGQPGSPVTRPAGAGQPAVDPKTTEHAKP